jgi:hypothetical protein
MKPTVWTGVALTLVLTLSGVRIAKPASSGVPDGTPLPPPIATQNSVELCLNSRYSQHSLTGAANDQQLGHIVWAAGRAPVTGTRRDIYVATPTATYRYEPNDHTLTWYSDEVTDEGAFLIRYDSELDFDTGVSFMPALLAAVSLGRSTESPVASCPKGLGHPKARLYFGVQAVRELSAELAVHSSVAEGQPGWLPDPSADGDNTLEDVLANLRCVSHFAQTDLTLQQISQLLWAGYGCSAHTVSNGPAGLTVPSAWATYYLTGSIYVANETGVWRYHNRNPSTNLRTRDHRLEQIDSGRGGRSGPRPVDARGRLQSAVSDLPAAPCYVILCLAPAYTADEYARLETGFVAGNVLMQATAIGLGCHFTTKLTAAERSGIQAATGIPSSHVPQAIVSVGPVEAVVSVSVTLQGESRPDAGWAVPLTVGLYAPGARVPSDTPAYMFAATSARSPAGDAAVCEVTGIVPDTYDIAARGVHTLTNVRRGVIVSQPCTAVDLGVLLEGDANQDNLIDVHDYVLLSAGWMAAEMQAGSVPGLHGENGYDARTDFDRNGLTGWPDLSLLAGNWLMAAPVEIGL